MVLASRGWLSISRAARNAHGAYARLLLLSGIVAVAWLAGGVGVAHSDTDSGGLVENTLGIGEVAEHTGQAAAEELRRGRVSDTAARTAASTEALTETVVPQASALPANALQDTGVSEALEETRLGAVTDRAAADTARIVDGTAREASGLVGEVARRGQNVVEATDGSLRQGTLVDDVTEGLTESVGHLRTDSAIEPGGPLGVPVLGIVDEPGVASEKRSESEERERSDEDDEQGSSPTEHGVSTHVAETGLRVATETVRAATREGVQEDEEAERLHLIAGGSQYQAVSDATGASAPSFSAPGAAGFLTNRSGHMVLRAQRVALPGDPTLVVRDVADDPSFSPD